MSTATTELMASAETVMGEPANFDRLKDHFDTVEVRVTELKTELGDIRFGDSHEFRGQAAQAFHTQIGAVDNDLGDLIDITRRLEQIFAHHSAELRRLRREADSALARAKTSWTAWRDAEDDRRAADRRIDWLESQLDQLIDDTGGEAARIEADLSHERRVADDARARETRSYRNLESVRGEWCGIVGEEQQLIERTASDLLSIDLEGLADPSMLEQLVNTVGAAVDFVVELGTDILEFVTDPDFLYFLYEFLEVASTLLSMLALVCAVFGLTAVAAILFTVVAVLAVTKFLVGLTLWASGDERVSGWDVVIDGVSAVFAVKGAAAANKLHSATRHWKDVQLQYHNAGRTIPWADKSYLNRGFEILHHKELGRSAIEFGVETGRKLWTDGAEAFNISALWSVDIEPPPNTNRHLCPTRL